jgi:hypothetical protein
MAWSPAARRPRLLTGGRRMSTNKPGAKQPGKGDHDTRRAKDKT